MHDKGNMIKLCGYYLYTLKHSLILYYLTRSLGIEPIYFFIFNNDLIPKHGVCMYIFDSQELSK